MDMLHYIRILSCCLLMTVFSSVYGTEPIYYDDQYGDAYGSALQEALTGQDYAVEGRQKAFIDAFIQAEAIEAFDFQAAVYAKARGHFYWYPQYKATIVIAVDREDPSPPVKGWQDLLYGSRKVGLIIDDPELACAVMAASYGLSGQLQAQVGIDYLRQLQAKDRLILDSHRHRMQSFLATYAGTAGAYILFDYQAAAMNQAGRHLEVIVPREGTLVFTKGLLSHHALNLDNAVLAEGLRHQGMRSLWREGRRQEDEAYQRAVPVQDWTTFLEEMATVSERLQNDVFQINFFTPHIPGEQVFWQLFCLIAVIFWSGSMMRRVVQCGVRQALLGCGFVSAAWIFVRILKFLETDPDVVRWLWYTYFGFELALSWFILWIAYATDRPAGDDCVPLWLRRLAIADAGLELFALTNDWHQWVFTFLPGFVFSNDQYGYGPMYLCIIIGIALQSFWALAVLVRKAWRQRSFKPKTILPFLVLLLSLPYLYGYITGIIWFRRTEVVLVLTGMVFLFLECSLRTGLISSNRGYIALFTRSELAMQIYHGDGSLAFTAAQTVQAGEEAGFHRSSMPITGGYVVWYEDVRDLRRKQEELRRLAQALQRSYQLLCRDEELRREYINVTTKNKLYEELEMVIASKKEPMAKYLALLQKGQPGPEAFQAIRRLNLLACYIKKRCVLLLRGKEKQQLSLEELHLAVEESSKYSREAGLAHALLFSLAGMISTEKALVLYDVYEKWVEQALLYEAPSALFNFYEDHGTVRLTVFFEEAYSWLDLVTPYIRAALPAGWLLECRSSGDAASICVFSAKGGAADG